MTIDRTDELLATEAREAGKARAVRLVPFTAETDDVPTWCWTHGGKGRLAVGSLGIFAGRPGAGKSTAGRWLAACASKGTLEGCWYGVPVNVAYIAAEESAKYVVKPGLRAADADMGRVFTPKVTFNGDEVKFLSSHDMDDLTAALIDAEVKIVVVDPLMSTIGSKTDINRNNEVRSLVEPWSKLAENIDGTVIGIAHLNKSGNGDVVAGINGSSAFGEVARAVFGFAKDPESEDGDRILSQEKNSIGEEDLALTYRIESQSVTTDSGKSADVGRFVITGDSDRSVGDVLRAPGRESEATGLNDEHDAWLLNLLLDGENAVSMLANEVYKSADHAGYSKDKMKRAKARINDEARKSEFGRDRIQAYRPTIPGSWHWVRTDRPRAQPDAPTPVDAAPLRSSAPLLVRGGAEEPAEAQGSKGAREHRLREVTAPSGICPVHDVALTATGKCPHCIAERHNNKEVS